MKIIKYPDNSSYAIIDNETDNEFTIRVNSYEDLWSLGQIIEALNFNGIKPIVTIPCLIDAQADKRFNTKHSSGLRLVCNFLNQFDVLKYKIFHPHNSEVLEASLKNVEIIDNSEFIKQVLNFIGNNIKDDYNLYKNLILTSSDSGGFKPLMKICDIIDWKGETFSASKARSWDNINGTKFIQQIDREDFKGKDILIVDDICVFGGTFKGLFKLFKERNVGKLYLATSHITIQNHGNNELFNLYDMVFTTNSKFDNYFVSDNNGGTQPKNLKIIKLF